MGSFGKSLSRELGKNTGKFISNKVFKDGHATPTRHIVQLERAKASVEREEKRIQYQKENTEEERASIENLSSFQFSTNQNELSDQINMLISLVSGEKSRRIKKVGIEKIEYGLTKISDPIKAEFFNKKFKKLNFKFNLNKYLLLGSVGIVIIGFFLSLIRAIEGFGILLLIIGIASLGIQGLAAIIRHDNQNK